jgi:hypothetical protein
MRRHLILVVACASVAAPAFALDMPARKPGLWQLTMTFEQPKLPSHVVEQCTDAATDKLLNGNFGGSVQQNCQKQEAHRAGATLVVDSVCSFGGATSTTHAVVNGNFNSAYTVKVVTRREGGRPMPGVGQHGEMHMAVAAKWLGPCAKGQRPGDMIMGNGMKMNVLDLQKMQRAFHPPRRPQ